jgi:MgtE intracellular N domain
MKIVIIVVGSFVMGLGGGALVGGTKIKNRLLEEHEQVRADSLAALEEAEESEDGAGRDGGVQVPLVGDSAVGDEGEEAAPRVPATGTETSDSAAAEAEGADVSAAEEGSAADSAASPRVGAMGTGSEEIAPPDDPETRPSISDGARAMLESEGAKKLAKIFGAMKPKDAAAVLQQMEDEEVEAILHNMSDRLAAKVLEAFDPARAAELSRVVLGGAVSGS